MTQLVTKRLNSNVVQSANRSDDGTAALRTPGLSQLQSALAHRWGTTAGTATFPAVLTVSMP